ncbi:hypothetical protein L581_4366 [Serratia fonticola AU-AP2C]|nr:hypothetical protein L581_4366 [Serratia fonticola AU-AP2C]
MINLSIGDINSLQFEPSIQGRIVLNVENGRVKSNMPVPQDNLIGPLELFLQMAKRCGDGFQTIVVPTGFSGKILVTAKDGIATGQEQLSEKHHVATMTAFLEMAQMAGFQVIAPDTDQ